MYNQSYEEYMQNILGYNPMYGTGYGYNMGTCGNCNAMPNNTYPYSNNGMAQNRFTNSDLEDCYPEIYKIVYPMVQKSCMKNTKPLTRDLIDEMVDEIYNAVEANDGVNINVTLNNNTRGSSNMASKNSDAKPDTKVKVKENKVAQNRQGNFLLNDLIRILLIRDLTQNPQNNMPPKRPPMNTSVRPNPQPRPPFPRTTGFMPNDFLGANYNIYEY